MQVLRPSLRCVPRWRGDREAGRGPLPVELRRAALVTPLLAIVMLLIALLLGTHYGVGIRDPDRVIGSRLLLISGALGLVWLADVLPRAWVGRAGGLWRSFRRTVAERWPWRRVFIVLGSIVAFYVVYFCYRNIKGVLPLARSELNDGLLIAIETIGGVSPASFLHTVLGTGISAHVLAVVYVSFLTFVPLSVGYALGRRDTAVGLWWVTALSINWILGALSYYLIPSLGPAFSESNLFVDLPDTSVTALQSSLFNSRLEFLIDPIGSGSLQGIGAFASLHVSIIFSGALFLWLIRAPRWSRIAMWVYFTLTTIATVYFGWHFLVDDLAGAVIGFIAVFGGGLLTGWRFERRRLGSPKGGDMSEPPSGVAFCSTGTDDTPAAVS